MPIPIFQSARPPSAPVGVPRSPSVSRPPAPDVPRGDGAVLDFKPLVIGKLPVAPTPPVVDVDAQLIAILDSPLAPNETAMTGFARKEHELGTAFAALTAVASRALHARLSRPAANDSLAQRFARLTTERRVRLLNFLADARRREALAAARR